MVSIFTDRRPLRQIGGLRAYLRQVGWSLRWRLVWDRPATLPTPQADRRRPPAAPDGAGAQPPVSRPAAR